MDITQDFIPENRGNRPGYAMVPQYISLHDTANPNATALNHAAYLSRNSIAERLPVSWHFSVDDMNIVQHLPCDESGWHAGDGTNGPGNRRSIGVEICEFADINKRCKAEENAARLAAYLADKFSIPVEFIVQHHHWTGKDCPRVLRARPGGWANFIDAVKSKIGGNEMFKDIETAMYPTMIEKAANLGLIAGYSDGTFRPKEPVTREQLIYFLLRYRERDLHQNTIADLVTRWKDSIVLITKLLPDGKLSFGSGSFIDEKGTILTNKHVTAGHEKLTVKIYGKYQKEAEFICDSDRMEDEGGIVDLALIRVPVSSPTPPVKIAKENPAHGEFCLVMGAPLVLEDSATFGIISHDKRGQSIQVDAAVNPGNSGGACFDMAGNMIGVPTSKYVGDNIDNIAYLTSAATARKFLQAKGYGNRQS